MSDIRILIVDDHPTFSEGLRTQLDDEEGLECIGIAGDGLQAIAQARRLKPDVILLDINMPKASGTQAAKEIHKSCPGIAIIMLSAYDYEAYVLNSLRAGARGYILKTSPLAKIVSAIQLVHKGESVLDFKATEKLVHNLHQPNRDNNKICFDMLHPRELEVIGLAGRGMSNKGIAEHLVISERTVQTHLVNIFRRLGATSRTQAVLFALKEGWIGLEETQKNK